MTDPTARGLAWGLTLSAAMLVALGAAGVCAARAGAQDVETADGGGVMHGPEEPPDVTPEGCGFVYDLEAPYVSLPCDMAHGSWGLLMCENRALDPRAVSATNDLGLWQINAYWQRNRIARMGYTRSDMLTAQPNTNVAAAIWREQAFRPWACREKAQ